MKRPISKLSTHNQEILVNMTNDFRTQIEKKERTSKTKFAYQPNFRFQYCTSKYTFGYWRFSCVVISNEEFLKLTIRIMILFIFFLNRIYNQHHGISINTIE